MTHITIERAKLEQWVKAVVSVARYAPAGEGVFSAVMMAQDEMNEVLRQALAAPFVQEPVIITQIAESHGRRVGNLWHFDDLALSIFASEVRSLCAPPAPAQPEPVVDCHATGVCVQSGLRAERPSPVTLISREQRIALREAFAIISADLYFEANPANDNDVGRMLFERGFARGFDIHERAIETAHKITKGGAV